jgi:hypothetical protein
MTQADAELLYRWIVARYGETSERTPTRLWWSASMMLAPNG